MYHDDTQSRVTADISLHVLMQTMVEGVARLPLCYLFMLSGCAGHCGRPRGSGQQQCFCGLSTTTLFWRRAFQGCWGGGREGGLRKQQQHLRQPLPVASDFKGFEGTLMATQAEVGPTV